MAMESTQIVKESSVDVCRFVIRSTLFLLKLNISLLSYMQRACRVANETTPRSANLKLSKL